jgi:dynein heavy chain
MMLPDYILVAEILLLAAGFKDSAELSRKLVKFFMLLSEQLSHQEHYDFGLRSMKQVALLAA